MSNARENVNLLTSADWDIATLRLASWGAGAIPPQVILKTNHTAGDGGGLFRYDAADTTTADNGGTVIVDAASNRWKRQWDGAVHSDWFYTPHPSNAQTTALQAWSGHPHWAQTSYNNNIRTRYAGIGFTFDRVRDAFITPQPYPSWTLDEATTAWIAPVPKPSEGRWRWDEETLAWIETELPV